jgi:Flp pilus assembly pilin Flp
MVFMRSKVAQKNKFLGLRSQRGVSMVEYTLLLSMIAIVAIVNLSAAGTQSRGVFETVEYELASTFFNP